MAVVAVAAAVVGHRQASAPIAAWAMHRIVQAVVPMMAWATRRRSQTVVLMMVSIARGERVPTCTKPTTI
jgi:hypothetical protein